MRQAGVAPKLSATPGRVRGGAPTRGQDSEELLASLGFTADAVAELREREVVGLRLEDRVERDAQAGLFA